MRRLLLATAIAATLALPARAATISIELTDDEQRVMINLIDQAVRATGLNGAEAGLVMIRKINMAAGAAAEKAKAEPTAKPPEAK